MTFKLRKYQLQMKQDILKTWGIHQNICGVLPTGSGKTVLFGTILSEYSDWSLVAAHRQELLGQTSLALAQLNVTHSILAPDTIIKWILRTHIQKFGKPYYDPQARCTVAGIDTLKARLFKTQTKNLLKRTSLWIVDECHHVLRTNKWGCVLEHLAHAKGLGMTATPERADGKGIGRIAAGIFDTILIGPNMQDLINMGYLCDYRIVCPPSNFNPSTLKLSMATGDYTHKSIVTTVRKSSIMGDVVQHYQKWAAGKRGVTFVPDVSTALDIAKTFKQNGISAEAIHAKTPNQERQSIIDRFEQGEILQVVNVDLIGEGFDLPALEVVIMARPTRSFPLFCQQFGRGSRPLPGKFKTLIMDHVGNTFLHGVPDIPKQWSLLGRTRKTKVTEVRIKVCPQCTSAYRPFLRSCPYCGFTPKPQKRSSPEFVEGDLTELDPNVLNKLRGLASNMISETSSAACLLYEAGAPPEAIMGARKNHLKRREAQLQLRESIAIWAALQRQKGHPDSESYRKFYHTWGIDVMSAQTLNYQASLKLNQKIREKIKL